MGTWEVKQPEKWGETPCFTGNPMGTWWENRLRIMICPILVRQDGKMMENNVKNIRTDHQKAPEDGTVRAVGESASLVEMGISPSNTAIWGLYRLQQKLNLRAADAG